MNLLKFKLAVILLLWNILAYAQEEGLFKKGIYHSFEEFIEKKPSFQGEFKLQEYVTGSFVRLYDLKVYDEQWNLTEYYHKMWGFSDGKDMYIKPSRSAPYFSKVLNFGPLVYFKYRSKGNMASTFEQSFNGVNYVAPSDVSFFMDLKTGKIHELKIKTLKKAIEGDGILFDEFMTSDNKDKKLEEFLLRYNERHPVSY